MATRQALQEFYPVHSNRIGTIHSLSIRKVPELLAKLRGLTLDNLATAPQSVQNFYARELDARVVIEDLLANGPKESPVVNEHLTLRPHQQLGREIAKVRNKFGFFFDTRTGKTPLSLSIIRDDVIKNPNHKWLVVCPLILIENAWLEDAEKFVPELTTINCHATTKAKRLKAMERRGNIYITNTESFATYKEYYDQMSFYGCIVDESSSMKSHKSQQSKALVEFAQTMKRFYLLSGTPAPNGEYEYYMQLKALDFYCVAPSYTKFKERYFINVSYNPQFEDLMLRPDARDALLALLKDYSLYVDKEDVLKTPGRTFEVIEFELPAELKKHYNKLKNEMYLELSEEKQIVVEQAAAKYNKLNQVTSGFVIDTQAIKENKFYGENQTEVHMLDDYRFKHLYRKLEELGDAQVLIWANYRKEFEVIREKLGKRCACVYGATSLSEKTQAIKDFKAGRIQYLIANPASADKGLTLTNAHLSIYFSLNYSYELFKQSMERIYGDISKQPKHCTYYIMIARGTIDAVLYKDVLQGKATGSQAILNHLKAGDI